MAWQLGYALVWARAVVLLSVLDQFLFLNQMWIVAFDRVKEVVRKSIDQIGDSGEERHIFVYLNKKCAWSDIL